MKPGTLTALLEEMAAAPEKLQGAAWESLLRPGAAVGRFELVRELGRGGFGVVWEARDRELGRAVAFKAVRAGGKAGLREERLLKEAEAAARLSHPNIVTLLDAGRAAAGPYLVLELLRGDTLEERLGRGAVPVPEALRIAVEVAKGMAHAHVQGVVHRDLKPANVFLCQDGQVKVLDFGLAHAFGQRRVEGGTPAYMAPEQAEGAPEDERTDVFALGVILFEMLAGKLPFEDEKALRATSAAPVLEVPGEPALGDLLSRMLAKRPVERPRDGAEALSALSALRREVAPATRPVRARRRWRLPALVASGALAGAGAAAVLLFARGASPGKAPGASPPSIAVLPFADMSPAKDQEYFADGVAEEILNALAHVQGLRVVGRTSSFSFKGKNDDLRTIGRKLDVATVLEGSVRRDGGRIRVAAQLVKASDGYDVWSETYDRELTGIFAVQDEIARAVASALQVKLVPGNELGSAEGQTANPEARNQYLLAAQFVRQGSRDSYRRAEEALQKAIRLDPGYARAHALLSWALWGRYNAGDAGSAAETQQLQSRSQAAAEKAVELAPGLAEAYQARGSIRNKLLWDWPAAKADLERALALNPNDVETLRSLGWLLAMLGRLAEAVDLLRRATDVDPLSAEAWRWLAFVSMAAGDAARAREAALRAVEIAPEHDWALAFLATSFLIGGDAASALATTERSRTEVWRLWGRALAQHSLGNAGQSQQALDRMASWAHISAYQIAEVHAWRGEPDRAFEWLERCYQDRDGGLTLMPLDPLMRTLRADPRYAALMRKMKLPVD